MLTYVEYAALFSHPAPRLKPDAGVLQLALLKGGFPHPLAHGGATVVAAHEYLHQVGNEGRPGETQGGIQGKRSLLVDPDQSCNLKAHHLATCHVVEVPADAFDHLSSLLPNGGVGHQVAGAKFKFPPSWQHLGNQTPMGITPGECPLQQAVKRILSGVEDLTVVILAKQQDRRSVHQWPQNQQNDQLAKVMARSLVPSKPLKYPKKTDNTKQVQNHTIQPKGPKGLAAYCINQRGWQTILKLFAFHFRTAYLITN